MKPLPTATSADARKLNATVAVLPVGAFEQHGDHFPLVTDTVVACAIAERVSKDFNALCLPPVTISCSQEHSAFAGTVSIRSATLAAVVNDVADSLSASGVEHLVIVNGHGGNYVLRNVVQEANVARRRMTLFPSNDDWDRARRESGMVTSAHDDMHAGELEASILLHVAPDLLRDGFRQSDHQAPRRPHLPVLGISGYSESGVIGSPSLGDAAKGAASLDSLSKSFQEHHRLIAE
nr:creatininase family protein [Aldersonia kunmingensis]